MVAHSDDDWVLLQANRFSVKGTCLILNVLGEWSTYFVIGETDCVAGNC